MFETDNRGQVGIGTLIVFIAMVLVAAVAAGVLINTAGFLQSHAEATGQESTSQVVDRVQVISVIGEDARNLTDAQNGTFDDASTDGKIDTLNLTISKSPGSGDINVDDSIVEIAGPDGYVTLTNEGIDAFEVTGITIGDGETVLQNQSDRVVMTLYLNSSEAGSAGLLGEGDRATIKITTAAGATTVVDVRAPETIQEGDTVVL